MPSFRIFFRDMVRIVGRDDFEADDSHAAEVIALGLLFDACSDTCSSYEVWQGSTLICENGARRSKRLDDLTAQHKAVVTAREEVIRDSGWAIASSRRLIQQLDG
jgi:hypothetical protein